MKFSTPEETLRAAALTVRWLPALIRAFEDGLTGIGLEITERSHYLDDDGRACMTLVAQEWAGAASPACTQPSSTFDHRLSRARGYMRASQIYRTCALHPQRTIHPVQALGIPISRGEDRHCGSHHSRVVRASPTWSDLELIARRSPARGRQQAAA